MKTNVPVIKIRKSFIRRLMILLGLFVILWVAYSITGDRMLRPIAVGQLHKLTGVEVGLGDVDFRLNGSCRIEDFSLGTKLTEPYKTSIFRAKSIDVHFSLLSIIRFKPTLTRISIDNFVIDGQYNVDTMKWNLQMLRFKEPPRPGMQFPDIKAKNGILKFSTVRDNKVKTFAIIGVMGNLTALKNQPDSYGFYLGADDRLAFGGSYIRGIWNSQLPGRVNMTAALFMDTTPLLGNIWDLDDIHLQLSYDEQNINIESLHASIGEKTLADINGIITNYSEDPYYDLNIDIVDGVISRETRRNNVVYGEVLDEFDPDFRGFMNQYTPHGLGDIHIRATGSVKNPLKARTAGEVVCKDVWIKDKNFPYLLENMTGTLDVTEKSVKMNDLKCSHGDVDLTISGSSLKIKQGHWKYDVLVSSDNMQLDEDIYRALETEQKRMWFTFTPGGLAAIRYRFMNKTGRVADRSDRLHIKLIDTHAVYQHFPYPLEHLSGDVYIDPNEIRLVEVKSHYNDGQDYSVTLDGNVRGVDSDNPRFNIVITADNVPIDDTLINALPAGQRAFYEKFDVDARTDAEIKVFPHEGGVRAVEYIARVTVRDASLVYEKLPLPLKNVNVDAVLTPDLFIIENLSADTDERGRLTLNGDIHPVNEKNSKNIFCLKASARNLKLRDDMFWALSEAGLEVFSKLKARGRVNVDADLNINAEPGQCSPYRIEVECLNNSLLYEKVPYELENIKGNIIVSKDLIEFVNLSSKEPSSDPNYADGKVVVDAVFRTEDKKISDASLNISASDVVLDDRFEPLLAKKLGDAYSDATPRGRIDLEVPNARVIRTEDGSYTVSIGGDVELKDMTLTKNKSITELNSIITGDLEYNLEKGLLDGRADVRVPSFKVKDRVVSDLMASLDYLPERNVLRTNSFTARSYGGHIVGDFVMEDFGKEESRYMLELVFDEISLKDFFPSSDTSSQIHEGLLGGSFSMRQDPGANMKRKGRLKVNISDIEVAQKALPAKMVKAVKKEKSSEPRFQRITFDSFLNEDYLEFQDVYMIGKSTVLRGTGTLNLDNSYVDLKFTAYGGDTDIDPSFLESLARGIGPGVAQVTVKGKIDDPEIETDALPVIKGPFELLGPVREP